LPRQQIDPSATLRDVLTRLPTMTNWQIKDIHPESLGPGAETGSTPGSATRP